MACAKDGTQAAIRIHLKSTLLSICPLVCAVFFAVLFFVCFAFCGFCFCLFSCWFVLALGNGIASWTM